MKRFFKLLLIATFAFALSFGLASCGGDGDTISKEEYDRIVAELAEKTAELAALQEDSVARAEFEAKVQELAEKVAELVGLQAELEALLEEVAEKEGAINDALAVINNLKTKPLSIVLPEGAETIEGALIVDIGKPVKVEAKLVETFNVSEMVTFFAPDPTALNFTYDAEAKKVVIDGLKPGLITVTVKLFNEVTTTLRLFVCEEVPNFDDTGKTKVVVGTPQMNGLFINGFGNSAYDVSIRNLIHGYSTLWTDPGEQFIWDTEAVLVAEPETELLPARQVPETVLKFDDEGEPYYEPVLDDNGNPIMKNVQDKLFKFKLQEDLKWNDGTPITAKDYIFSLLFSASRQWADVQATSTVGDQLLGYTAYRSADTPKPDGASTPVFVGARLVGTHEFHLIINGENLPYFYESTMVALSPAPMHVYAPGADVVTDPETQGVYLTGFTPAHAQWVKDVYCYNPTVSCGPYKFIYFKNQVVRLEKNPYFKTDGEGYAPQIDIIEQRWINQDTDVYQVIAGEVDIVAGVIEGEKIEALKASETAYAVTYSRNGYGMIAFACDFGPTKEAKVRQALGMLVDRNEFVQEILGGYGVLVNGAYGLSQWMYQLKEEEIETELIKYSLNIDLANEYLDQTDWKYEADGVTPFDKTKAGPDKEYYRHNSKGEMLQINHFGTTENDITDLIALRLPVNCASAGIKFTVTYGGFDTLLNHFYYGYTLEESERVYHSFNLATNFASPYDPYYSWHSVWVGRSYYNSCQLADSILDQYIEEMRKQESNELGRAVFADAWLQFQIRWNELLPSIPLYSNQYFDAVNNRVQGLQTTPTFGWARAIIRATVAG